MKPGVEGCIRVLRNQGKEVGGRIRGIRKPDHGIESGPGDRGLVPRAKPDVSGHGELLAQFNRGAKSEHGGDRKRVIERCPLKEDALIGELRLGGKVAPGLCALELHVMPEIHHATQIDPAQIHATAQVEVERGYVLFVGGVLAKDLESKYGETDVLFPFQDAVLPVEVDSHTQKAGDLPRRRNADGVETLGGEISQTKSGFRFPGNRSLEFHPGLVRATGSGHPSVGRTQCGSVAQQHHRHSKGKAVVVQILARPDPIIACIQEVVWPHHQGRGRGVGRRPPGIDVDLGFEFRSFQSQQRCGIQSEMLRPPDHGQPGSTKGEGATSQDRAVQSEQREVAVLPSGTAGNTQGIDRRLQELSRHGRSRGHQDNHGQ